MVRVRTAEYYHIRTGYIKRLPGSVGDTTGLPVEAKAQRTADDDIARSKQSNESNALQRNTHVRT
jgi:hypothetical protein